MDVLWNRDEWLAPADVVSLLERSHPIAYTTAMTILVRLWNKGMVDRRQSGRAFTYRPVMTRDEWTALRMYDVLETASNRPAALSRAASVLRGIGLGVYAEGVSQSDDLQVVWSLGFDGATGPAVTPR